MTLHSNMTPSEQCKAAGLKSIAEVARLIGKPAQTLHNWHRDYPALFEVVVLGAAEKMRENSSKKF